MTAGRFYSRPYVPGGVDAVRVLLDEFSGDAPTTTLDGTPIVVDGFVTEYDETTGETSRRERFGVDLAGLRTIVREAYLSPGSFERWRDATIAEALRALLAPRAYPMPSLAVLTGYGLDTAVFEALVVLHEGTVAEADGLPHRGDLVGLELDELPTFVGGLVLGEPDGSS